MTTDRKFYHPPPPSRKSGQHLWERHFPFGRGGWTEHLTSPGTSLPGQQPWPQAPMTSGSWLTPDSKLAVVTPAYMPVPADAALVTVQQKLILLASKIQPGICESRYHTGTHEPRLQTRISTHRQTRPAPLVLGSSARFAYGPRFQVLKWSWDTPQQRAEKPQKTSGAGAAVMIYSTSKGRKTPARQ